MTDMTVANTILEQLGGRMFRIMTGAKDFVGDANSLKFKLPKAQKGIKYVRITLTPEDLYDVEFAKLKGLEWTVISKSEGVYVDMLRKLFETETGLYVRF
jgi:hypothetical protein